MSAQTDVIMRLKQWFSIGLSRLPGAKKVPFPDSATAQPLPTAVEKKLRYQLAQLSPPTPQIEAAVAKVLNALQNWQQQTGHQSLVILTKPVESGEQLLTAAIAQIQQSQNKPGSIASNLDYYTLELEPAHPEEQQQAIEAVEKALLALPASTPQRPVLVIVPALEQYFLRCVDGLERMDALRQAITKRTNYFWLMSCNQWAWCFLDAVCHLPAYLPQCWTVPTLTPQAIQAWLAPVLSTVSPELNESNDLTLSFFSALGNAANGIASVAGALWLQALRYEPTTADRSLPTDPTTDAAVTSADGASTNEVKISVLQKDLFQKVLTSDVLPSGSVETLLTPKLPHLTSMQRFILFSVLLHRTISTPRLCLSLAEPEGKIQAESKELAQIALIRHSNWGWEVNPLHYPSLAKDLRRNNFLLDVDA